jgi:para-nitrobenzyl esterase
MSVSTLLGTPSAAGLFSRAIVQSGHADLYQDMDEARSVSRWFATKLGVPYDETTLATLRRVDATKLMSAQADLTSETPVPFTMVVDSHHLPIPPIDAIATGATASVPLMIGTNTDENKLFRALAWGPTVPPGGLSDRLAALFIDTTPQSERPAALVEHLLRTYQALAHGDDDAWDIVATDRMWRAPVWKLMDAYASAGGSVFSYEFALTTPVRGGILGACHALEIPFVFGNLRQPGVTEFIGDDITPGSVAASVSAMMNATWAEFARQGRPVHPDLPVWPEFKQGSRQQMCFSADTHLREDPCQARTLWWIEHERLLQPAFELWTRAGVSRRSNFIRSTGTR